MTAPVTGDAMLLALAAEYRAANIAVLAFDDEENVWTGVMATYLAGVRDNHDHRRDSLAEAIAAVKADVVDTGGQGLRRWRSNAKKVPTIGDAQREMKPACHPLDENTPMLAI